MSAAVSVVAVLGMGTSLAATPAAAAQPWWHLTSGSRATYINPSAGRPEVPAIPGEPKIQTITEELAEVAGAPEQAYLILGFEDTSTQPPTEVSLGEFATEPTASLGFPPLTSAEVKAALEANHYPVQSVEVSAASGVLTIKVVSQIGSGPLLAQAGEAQLPTPVVTTTQQGTTGVPAIPAKPDGVVTVYADNLGDAPASGSSAPITVTDVLPPGLTPVSVKALTVAVSSNEYAPLDCEAPPVLSCTLETDLAPYHAIEMRIGVDVEPGAASGGLNRVSVSGGGTTASSLARPLTISTQSPPFGIEDYELRIEEEGGAPTTAAASHPYQVTGIVGLNQGEEEEHSNGTPFALPVALPKDIDTELPPGLLGNPSQFPVCKLGEFSQLVNGSGANLEENGCPADTAVGVATVIAEEPGLVGWVTAAVPIFNLEPSFGEPARFGFAIPIGNVLVSLDTSLRDGPGEDYGITVHADNVTQGAGTILAQVSFWGVPGDARHDSTRGWSCLTESGFPGATHGLCVPSGEPHPPALLTMPTSCSGPLQTSVLASSWNEPSSFGRYFPPETPQALGACNQVPFSPTIHSEPTSDAASSPTGLKFDIDLKNEGLTNSNPGAKAESNLKRAVVTLPEGFTTNPALAGGLKACSQAEYEAATDEPGTGCLLASKIGDVEIESPAIESRKEKVISGGLYVARQHQNPFGNLLTLYMIARAPELGVVVRQALKVEPNPTTGQLTTTVDNVPQLPFSHFHLDFRTGQRAPLITPPACGTYAVKAKLYPYSNPEVAREEESSFKITSGFEGRGCPSGNGPFHPSLESGTVSPLAAAYSPFVLKLSRSQAEQPITSVDAILPEGLLGRIAGITECSDAQIAQAATRSGEGEGALELATPSCPKDSEVGAVNVGAGAGSLTYVQGHAYLAGPYKGAPLSLAIVTPAIAGPFDLGTVVTRVALYVNETTAQVHAVSDPLPHIIVGIPLDIRSIALNMDRPQFTLNPTSCTAKEVLAGATSLFGATASATNRFQVGGCKGLAFKPVLQLFLSGQIKRTGNPALKAVLTQPKGENANIARTSVILPKGMFIDNSHINGPCTRVQFNEGRVPGEKCPKTAVLGTAKAWTPLLDEPEEGKVYFRSNGGERELPDLVVALRGKIPVQLVGFIDSVGKKGAEVRRVRTRFQSVPDAPVSRFELKLFGGKRGLLENSNNLCHKLGPATYDLTGQNGKIYNTEPKVQVSCGKKSKKKTKGGH